MEPGISRMTVTVEADPLTVEQIVKQLNKLVNVLKVNDLTDETSVERELMLIKVKAEPGRRSEIQQVAATFRAKIIDISPDSMIIEVTGEEQKLQAFLLMMQEFGIKEIVSTGSVSLLRGSKVTRELRA
jgi:acetolactate synthase-1/3 small subunit